MNNELKILEAKVRETEREEIAIMLESLTLAYPHDAELTVKQCVNAIRARNVNPESYVLLTHPRPYKEGIWDKL